MPGFRHTGAVSKGCSDVDVRQSAEAIVPHTIRIVEVGLDPVCSLRHSHLDVFSFYKASLPRILRFHEAVFCISICLYGSTVLYWALAAFVVS
jgi:hypothetical protein